MKPSIKNGFSLVETLVVIAIIGILSGVVILRIVSPKHDVDLESAGNIIQSTVIRARDLARAPQQGGVITDILTTNGYGILFPAVGTTDISSIVFRDLIDVSAPTNQNKWVDPTTTTVDDVNVSTTWLKDSDVKNIRVLKYIIYDASNNMSEDTTTGTRNFVFLSSDTPTKEKVYYNGSLSFTRVGISIQHTITQKEVRIFIHANGDVTVETYIPPSPKTLTISYAGTGTGTAVPNPAGTSFAHGTSVSVTATPSGGSSFGGWSGACSGSTNPCVTTMDSNKTLIATFNPPPPPPPPPYCGDGTCNGSETWQTCADCPVPVTVSNISIGSSYFRATYTSANGGQIALCGVNIVGTAPYGNCFSGGGILINSGTTHTLNMVPQTVISGTTYFYDIRIFIHGNNGAYSGYVIPGDSNRQFYCNSSNVCGQFGSPWGGTTLWVNNVSLMPNIVINLI